ncbi:MAG: hypothetical protein ACTSX7_10935 [Alphaproteobacteria bacterium]
MPEKTEFFLLPRESAEIVKVITRILKMRGREAPPIEMQHLSALFAVEWPYDFDKLFPGRRERVFSSEIVQQLGFRVDEKGGVTFPGPGDMN